MSGWAPTKRLRSNTLGVVLLLIAAIAVATAAVADNRPVNPADSTANVSVSRFTQ